MAAGNDPYVVSTGHNDMVDKYDATTGAGSRFHPAKFRKLAFLGWPSLPIIGSVPEGEVVNMREQTGRFGHAIPLR